MTDKQNAQSKIPIKKQSRLCVKKAGFTLTEIVVTIIILGVLSTLTIPRMTGTIERVRASEGVHLLTALLSAQKIHQFETGAYATDPDDLDVEIDEADNFDIPPTVANPGNPVTSPIATITRAGSYILGINEEGTITCTDVGSPVFTCAQAGY